MRSDMKKKLVDCYRIRRGPNRDVRRLRREGRNLSQHIDDSNEMMEYEHTRRRKGYRGRRQQGYRMRNDYDRKDFGENLSPLKRFLWSARGCPWDEIYSEISEFCDKDTAVGRHIYEHLWGYVVRAEDVDMIDGVPHWRSGWMNGRPITGTGYPGGSDFVYINPDTGILEETPRSNYPALDADEEAEYVVIDDITCCLRHEGVWFILVLAPQEYEPRIRRRVRKNAQGELELYDQEVMSPVHRGVYTQESLPTWINLPAKFWARINEKTRTEYPQGYGYPRVTIQEPATHYIKVFKTMSKREKRQLL